jgi:hypothetical protein
LKIDAVLEQSRSWEGDVLSSANYNVYFDMAEKREWLAQNPMAVHSPAGILQNDIRMIVAGDDRVSVSSHVPISENFGLMLRTTYNGAAGIVGQTVIARANFGLIYSSNPVAGTRDMMQDDRTISDILSSKEMAVGGTLYDSPVDLAP